MIQIADIFLKNNSSVATYKGKEIKKSYDIPIKVNDILKVAIKKTNSDWRQGVSLIFTKKKTKLQINEHIMDRSNTLWSDTAPKVVRVKILKVDPSRPFLTIRNSWFSNDELINFPDLGGAMKVNKKDNLYKFACNDGHDDDDFDDLIFTLEHIKSDKKE